MNFATDDLREDILDLFVNEHYKINDFDYVYADLTIIDIEQKRATEKKSRILDLAWIRRHDRERKNLSRFKTPDTIECAGCSRSMPSFLTNGHPRKYCSERCRKKIKNAKRYN